MHIKFRINIKPGCAIKSTILNRVKKRCKKGYELNGTKINELYFRIGR